MAQMKQVIGDQPSGKLMNVVFYTRYGKNYVRMAPKKRDNYTDEQLLYRQRMSKASALWRSLKSEETSKIWQLASEGMNNYAWFMKANLPAFEMDGTLIDARLIKVTDGKLPLPQDLKAERMPDDAHTVVVSWQIDPNTNPERRKDELWAMSYADGKFSRHMATGLKRSDLQGAFTLSAKPANATHVFLWMRSENGEEYSESLAFHLL